MESNPRELGEPIPHDAVTRRRNLFCTRYDACLDEAAERGWLSWTCERCELHAFRREMAARYAEEHHYRPVHATEGALSV